MGTLLDRYLQGGRPEIGNATEQLFSGPTMEEEGAEIDPRLGDPTFEARKADSQAQAPLAYAQSRIDAAKQSALTTLEKYGTQLPAEERDRLMRIANGEDVLPEEGFFGKLVSVLDTPAEMIRLFIADISGADEKTGFEIEGSDYWQSLFQNEDAVRENAFQQALLKFNGDAEKATAQVDALFGHDTGSGVLGSMAHTLEALGWDDESVASNVARGVLGFAADVLLDPTTYITFGTAGLGKKFALESSRAAVKSASVDAMARGFRNGAPGGEQFVQDMAKSITRHADEAQEELVQQAVKERLDTMAGEGWKADSLDEIADTLRAQLSKDEEIVARAEQIGRDRAEAEFLNPIAQLVEAKQFKTLDEQFPSFTGYSHTHPAITGGLKLTTPLGRRDPNRYINVGWKTNRNLTAPVRKILGKVEDALPDTVRRAIAWMKTRTGAEQSLFQLAKRQRFWEFTEADARANDLLSSLSAASAAPTIRNTIDALHTKAGANGDAVTEYLMDTLDSPLKAEVIEAEVRALSGNSDEVWQAFNETRQVSRTLLGELYNAYRQFDPRIGHIQDYVPAIQTRAFSQMVSLLAEKGTTIFPKGVIEDDELRQGLELLSEFVAVAGGRKGVHTEASLGYTRFANSRAWDRTVYFPMGDDTSVALMSRDKLRKLVGEMEAGHLPREHVNRVLKKAVQHIVDRNGADLGVRRIADDFSPFERDLGTVMDKYVGGMTEAVRIRALVKELEGLGMVQKRTWGQSVGRTLSALKHVLDDDTMKLLEDIAKKVESKAAVQKAGLLPASKPTTVRIADGLDIELPESVVKSDEGKKLLRKLRAIVAPLAGKRNELKGSAAARTSLLESRGLPRNVASQVAAGDEAAIREAQDHLSAVLRTTLRERLAAVATMLSDDVDGETAVTVLRQIIDQHASEMAEVTAKADAMAQRFIETVKVSDDDIQAVDLTAAREGAVETPLAVLGREAAKRATESFENMKATMDEVGQAQWGDMIRSTEIEQTTLGKVGEEVSAPSVGPIGVDPWSTPQARQDVRTGGIEPPDPQRQAELNEIFGKTPTPTDRAVPPTVGGEAAPPPAAAGGKTRRGESELYHRPEMPEMRRDVLDFIESDAVHELNPQLKLALVDAFDNQVTFDTRFVAAARDDLLETLEASGLTPIQFLESLEPKAAIDFARKFFGVEFSQLIRDTAFNAPENVGSVSANELMLSLFMTRENRWGSDARRLSESWTWDNLRNMNPQTLHDDFFTDPDLTTLWVHAHEALSRQSQQIAAKAFSAKTVKELRREATEAAIPGRSKMRKGELVEALSAREAQVSTIEDAAAELQQKMGMYQKAYITASRDKGMGSVFNSRGQAIQGANIMAAMVRGDMGVLLAPGNEAGVRRVFKLLGLDPEGVRFRRTPRGQGTITYQPPRTRALEMSPAAALKDLQEQMPSLKGLSPTQIWASVKSLPPNALGKAGDVVRAFGHEPEDWITYLRLLDRQYELRFAADTGWTMEQDHLLTSILDAVQRDDVGEEFLSSLWQGAKGKLKLAPEDMDRLQALVELKLVPERLKPAAQAWFDEWFQAVDVPVQDVMRRLDEVAENIRKTVPMVTDEEKQAWGAINEFIRRFGDLNAEYAARRNVDTYAHVIQDEYRHGLPKLEGEQLADRVGTTVASARRALTKAERAVGGMADESLQVQAVDFMRTKLQQLEDATDEIIKAGKIPLQDIDKFADPTSRVLAVAGLEDKLMDRDVLGVVDTLVGNIQGLYTPEGVTLLAQHARGAMNWWKVMATISRPTFNIRNFIGGVWNNLIGDVGMREYGTVASNMLRYRRAIQRGATPEAALDAVHANFKPYLVAMMEEGVLATQFAATLPSQVKRGMKGISPNLMSAKKSPLVRVGAWGMQSVEDFHRAAAFVRAFDPSRPETARAAKALAEALHFDYRNLTSLERSVTTFIPFFVWTRRNLPLQLRMVMEKPGVLTKYQHLVKNAEASLGGDDSTMYDDMYLPFGTSSLALLTDVVFDENTPFAQRAIIDPQLPIGDLEQFMNEAVSFSPVNWIKWLSSSVAPWFTTPQEVMAAEEYGYVNAPAGISEIAEVLMKIGLFDDRTTQSGDAQISYGWRQLIETVMPWHRETIGAVFPTDPKRAQRLGVSQEDADGSGWLEGVLATLGGGVGLKRQTAEDQLGEAYDAGEEVRDVTSVAQLQGMTPQEAEEFVRPAELPGIRR